MKLLAAAALAAALCPLPSHALTIGSWADWTGIRLVDLNPNDGITPAITLAPDTELGYDRQTGYTQDDGRFNFERLIGSSSDWTITPNTRVILTGNTYASVNAAAGQTAVAISGLSLGWGQGAYGGAPTASKEWAGSLQNNDLALVDTKNQVVNWSIDTGSSGGWFSKSVSFGCMRVSRSEIWGQRAAMALPLFGIAFVWRRRRQKA